LTDQDRDQAAELNRMRFANQRAKLERENAMLEMESQKRELQLRRDMTKLQAEIADYEGEDPDENGSDDDLGLNSLFKGLIASQINNRSAPLTDGETSFRHHPTETPLPSVSLSNDQIQEIWKGIPKPYRKLAKTLDDQQIRAIVENKIGSVTEDTFKQIVKTVKG
jgi:hypothetical protein